MLKLFGFSRIDRLSLLRQVTMLAAGIVAILGFILAWTTGRNHFGQLTAIFALTLPAAAWGLNRWALPAAARKQRFFLFAFATMGIFFYLGLSGIFLDLKDLKPEGFLQLIWPVVNFFLAFFLFAPAYLALSLSLGGALSFLYRRRDYLPEVL